MKKIDLNKPLLRRDGENVIDGNVVITLGQVLSTILENSKIETNPIKIKNWVLEVYKTGELQVDEVDFSLIKQAVEICPIQNVTAFIKGQILEELK